MRKKKTLHFKGIENKNFKYANADKTVKKWIVNRDIIFVHVPKNAGKSVWGTLAPKLRNTHGIIPTHLPLVSTIYPEGAFTFGFVRNPWDRMVSLYYYLCFKAGRDKEYVKKKQLETLGFKKYLQEFNYHLFNRPHKPDPVVNRWCIPLHVPIQKRSQMHWLEGCVFIGRFETLHDDLKEAARLGGFKLDNLSHMNKSRHRHYTEYYDDETIAFIAEHFKQEIDRFNYRYGEN